MLKLFILEDDLLYGAMLRHHLQLDPDCDVRLFQNVSDFTEALSAESPDIVSLDYSLPDGDASGITRLLTERFPDTSIIIVSGQDRVDRAVDLLKLGVRDYIVKDAHTQEKLWLSVRKLKTEILLRKENENLKEALRQANATGNTIIGNSAAAQQLQSLISKAAGTDINVTLYGETGTGKELAAKAIHRQSRRSAKPFVAVNVAAIPSELAESELFGHEKGAFTGAGQRRQGCVEAADGGTLFLDEIGEMPLFLQAKLLRVLQDKAFTRVGGNQPIQSDFRLIVATHRQLPQMVKEGKFREDLYYRLQGLPVQLTPLRSRGSDVILIAQKLMADYCREQQLGDKQLSPEVARMLLAHPWPGNVRELKNAVELACVLSDGKMIEPAHLLALEQESAMLGSKSRTLKEYTTQLIQHHLDENGYDVVQVARLLSVGKSTLYRMIQNQELRLEKNGQTASK